MAQHIDAVREAVASQIQLWDAIRELEALLGLTRPDALFPMIESLAIGCDVPQAISDDTIVRWLDHLIGPSHMITATTYGCKSLPPRSCGQTK